jgi:hypothetical protein
VVDRLLLLGVNPPLPEEDQVPVPAAPATEPLSDTDPDALQTVGVEETLTVATGLIVNPVVLLSAGHTPLLVEVNVKFTEPVFLSPFEIVYTVETELLLTNDPLPFVVHAPEFVDPVTVADKARVLLVEQRVVAGEMLTVAWRNIVDMTVALVGGQPPLLVEVSV